MNEDQMREAMAKSVPPRFRPKAWVPRVNGHQHGRINHASVVAMKENGKTNREIADALFCELDTVQNILRTHRLKGARA